MKVLGVFSTDQVLGGGEISFSLSLRGLKDAGCEVSALLPGEGPLSRHLHDIGIPYATAPQDTLRRGGSVQFLLRPHPEWLQIAGELKPDVIHCNAVRSALYGQAIGRALSIPTVFHARTSQKDPPYDHFLMATTRAVVCTSQAVKERFPVWLGPDRLYVIPNAVAPSFLKADEAQGERYRAGWLAGAGGPLIGVVGRISPAKGQHHVVQAGSAILREYPSCRFVFIGDEDPSCPGYASELTSMLESRGYAHAFVFAGFIRNMADAYLALDMVAFPTASEGFGRVVIEAGALGRPVVATNLPVLRELMPRDLQDQLLCEPSQLAAALTNLVRLPAVRHDLGNRLRKHVMDTFTLDRHVRQLMNLYRRL